MNRNPNLLNFPVPQVIEVNFLQPGQPGGQSKVFYEGGLVILYNLRRPDMQAARTAAMSSILVTGFNQDHAFDR